MKKPRLLLGAFLIFCFLNVSIYSEEQDARLDPAGIYKLPHEAIPPSEVAKIKQSILESEKSGTELDGITAIRAYLDPYYAQFVDPKRTEEEKRLGRIFTEKTDRNTLRLLILKMLGRITESGILRDSPILFELHSLLGKEYLKKKQNTRALEEAITALRYRDFSHTEDSFSKEERLRELSDSGEISGAKQHGELRKQLRKAEEVLSSAKDRVHLLEAEAARGKELIFEENQTANRRKIERKDILAAKDGVKQEEARLRELENSYKDSFEKNYFPYFRKKSREDAEAVYHLAKLVKNAENDNKERLKVVNKASVSGQGIFVLFDYKRNTDYFAYAALLEIAYRLDSEYSSVVLDLANEFRSSGKKAKALDFFLKYLVLAQKENRPPAELAPIYRNIASLHTELKQYVLGAEFYEKYYSSESDAKKKAMYAYELGNFFETKIGNLEKSNLYYSDWLQERAREAAEVSDLSFAEAQERQRMEVLAYVGISKLHRYEKKFSKEREALLKAIDSYFKLQGNLKNEESKHSELTKQLLIIKRGLLERTNDQDMAQYRLKNLEIDESKEKIDIIRTKLDAAPGARAMQRVSVLFEYGKDYPASKKWNEEILKIGTQAERNVALRNLERINKIQEDGIPRDPYPRDPLASELP
ncbi:hypothetical protein CH373_04635 [Leptospira perolatii]|uniref:Tetratricopeptide repeat protein n=1 Tax=Leptospira perolatii TaxID=2023191 RepID=A0A2M9ZQ80_9LEPT|nr:hypothetical protein [Leptospira perolatii]PJZ68056.1 hypothetical protein CH360_18220 [Leptospira perolatii]PJZ74204.1 hypothetical protein CH373_04635 [Leptospira perolatii]